MQNVDSKIGQHKAKLHRTAHYSPEQIDHLRENATRQEKHIARWYFANPAGESPTWLHEALGFDWPITSTRRAITNLTDVGILVKTERVKQSVHGRPEHIWRWRTPDDAPVEPAQGALFEAEPQTQGPYTER